jgi:predicted small lipoprotein YifL
MSILIKERLATLCVAAILLLAGCAEKGPIFLDIAYRPPAAKSLGISDTVIGISRIRDGRGIAPSVLGKRIVASGMENDLVTEGTVADRVTTALKDAMRDHGITVKDAAFWDMTPEGMPEGGYNLLIGGEIESLWLDSVSVPFKTSLKASVRMKIAIGDVAEKKVLRVVDVKSKIDEDILYSREKLADLLSEALSSALDQIFQDDVLRSKIH